MVRKDHYDQIDNSNNQYAKLRPFQVLCKLQKLI